MRLILYDIVFLITLCYLNAFSQPARPLNVVLILVDDLGWSDLTCYGSDLHETPHIDRLSTQGIFFTDAYAASPVCSPSRAALMSGEHPARLHMTTWREAAKHPPLDKKLIPPLTEENLPLDKVTLAEQLKEAGYLTVHIGKWHLGDAPHYPQTQGFDIDIGATLWGCPKTFFYPFKGFMHGDFRYVPGLGTGKEGDYLPDRLTTEAVRIIEGNSGQPFFLYMAYYTVHTPLEAKAADIAYFEKKIKAGMKHVNATYAAMVKSMDENVGRILASLEKKEISDQTIVIFTSDNGGFNIAWRQFPVVTNNAPLRSGKGSLYEGGIRVPLIIRWPGVTHAGDICHEPVVLTDLYSTLAYAQGFPPAATDNQQDGRNLYPLLSKEDLSLDREALFWHFPHYYPTTTPVSAMRRGKWKLLEYLEDNRLELYNLEADQGEKHNLALQNPQQAADLQRQLADWREQVEAQMPESSQPLH